MPWPTPVPVFVDEAPVDVVEEGFGMVGFAVVVVEEEGAVVPAERFEVVEFGAEGAVVFWFIFAGCGSRRLGSWLV